MWDDVFDVVDLMWRAGRTGHRLTQGHGIVDSVLGSDSDPLQVAAPSPPTQPDYPLATWAHTHGYTYHEWEYGTRTAPMFGIKDLTHRPYPGRLIHWVSSGDDTQHAYTWHDAAGRLGIAAVALPHGRSDLHLVTYPETVASRITGRLFGDIDVESIVWNQSWRVVGADQATTTHVITPRVITALTDPPVTDVVFGVSGGWVMLLNPNGPFPPDSLMNLFTWLTQTAAGIPRDVQHEPDCPCQRCRNVRTATIPGWATMPYNDRMERYGHA